MHVCVLLIATDICVMIYSAPLHASITMQAAGIRTLIVCESRSMSRL